jgi:hypothetical protein
MTIHRRSRRTVLTASLAATAGLVGGMAIGAFGPSTSGATATAAGSSSLLTGHTPSAADQNSAGVWIAGDDDGGRFFAPAQPSTNVAPPTDTGPVMSSHGS